jgi:hypothetical protein
MVNFVFSGLVILEVTIYVKKITMKEFRSQFLGIFLATTEGYIAFKLTRFAKMGSNFRLLN